MPARPHRARLPAAGEAPDRLDCGLRQSSGNGWPASPGVGEGWTYRLVAA